MHVLAYIEELTFFFDEEFQDFEKKKNWVFMF